MTPFSFPFEDLFTYRFHRPFYEREGWTARETDNGYLIVLNALGIKSDDIEVKADTETVSVYGKTHNEDLNRDFEVSVTYGNFRHSIESVDWESVNGLLKIWVNYAKPENKVKVARK